MSSRTPGVLLVAGAYGREATLADWAAGKDFKIYQGPYCSSRDIALMIADGWNAVVLLDRRGEEVARIELKNEVPHA